MAQRSRSQLFAWLAVGGVVACTWCALLSGGVGWALGQDLGWRQGRVEGRAEARAELLPAAGVIVTRLDRNGPAYRAGIRASDLIVAVDGVAVADVPALHDAIVRVRSGDTVQLTVQRQSGQQTLPVRLATLPGTNQPYLGIYYTARAEEPGDV